MALVDLLRTPEDAHALMDWSFAHRIEHERIRDAIQAQASINLPSAVIEPINIDDMQNWLTRHQALHADFTGVLNIQSSDLETVKFDDLKQRRAWIELHYFEHFLANSVLGI